MKKKPKQKGYKFKEPKDKGKQAHKAFWNKVTGGRFGK